MKLDIVRAWKDETYRQSLSVKQLYTLPANPVGELTDADLAVISGTGMGDGSFGSPFEGGFFGASSDHVQVRKNFESLAQTCENNCFTCNWISADHFSITNTLSPTTQICADTH